MDKKKGGSGIFGSGGKLLKTELDRRKNDKTAVVYDIAVFLLGVIFARAHLIFGTYPIAPAFICVLPRGVLFSLIGGVLGALSLGSSGVIHAVVLVVAVFLRSILSFGKGDDSTPFCEPLLFRIASASSAVFIGAVYESVYGGIKVGGLLFGAIGVLSAAVFTFLFSGIYDGGVSFSDMLTAERSDVFEKSEKGDKIGRIFFILSLVSFVFLITFSLKEYVLFGINASHVFASFLTLLSAKRFGVKWSAAAGFVSGIAIGPIAAAAFLLVGIFSGLLFKLGTVYATIGGGIVISVWAFYTEGMVGFLSFFPEYSLSSILLSPIFKNVKTVKGQDESAKRENASNIANTASLIYKSKCKNEAEKIEKTFSALSDALAFYSKADAQPSREEYHSLITNCVSNFCSLCKNYGECKKINPAPCAESIDNLTSKMHNNEKIDVSDTKVFPLYCKNSLELKKRLEETKNSFIEYRSKDRHTVSTSEEYALLSKLVAETARTEKENTVRDEESEKKVFSALYSYGFKDATVLIFGERKKHIIISGTDKNRDTVTNPDFIKITEMALGEKIAKPMYYKKGESVLFESETLPKLKCEYAIAASPRGDEISGDTFKSFKDNDGRDYFLLSDGMGSGETASKTSVFTTEVLAPLLFLSSGKSTALKLLNSMIRERGQECSATVDLFEIDTYMGNAFFYKCGSAPSYIKREDSVFRIKSETAPIGLMKKIDAERIRADVKSGDYIIMISDGVSQSQEDEGKLIAILSKPPSGDAACYASEILNEILKSKSPSDDRTVAVIKIRECA